MLSVLRTWSFLLVADLLAARAETDAVPPAPLDEPAGAEDPWDAAPLDESAGAEDPSDAAGEARRANSPSAPPLHDTFIDECHTVSEAYWSRMLGAQSIFFPSETKRHG